MKKLISLLMLSLVLVLAACGGTDDQTNKETKKKKDVTIEDIVQTFKDEGIEVGEIVELGNDEFGDVRKDGKRILIPSLGNDAGGRLMSFEKDEDLKKVKSYYDDLGKSSPMLYSHTHQSGLFLLQMNGDMEDNEFSKYAKAMDETVTGTSDIEVKDEPKMNKAENLTDAQVGDVVEDSFAGVYTIEESLESPTDKYKSADVVFTIDEIKTAKLVAEDPDLIETSKETNVLILSVTGENLSDETVSFHPDSSTMTTDTKRQIESNVMISSFESEFIGKVIQKGEVIFDLGEEGLEDVTELKFVFEGTAKDAMKIGEEVTIIVPVNKK